MFIYGMNHGIVKRRTKNKKLPNALLQRLWDKSQIQLANKPNTNGKKIQEEGEGDLDIQMAVGPSDPPITPSIFGGANNGESKPAKINSQTSNGGNHQLPR